MKKLYLVLYFCFILVSSYADVKKIEIKNSWVRPAFGDSRISAAYMEIKNNSADILKIVGVKSSVSKFSEIHNMFHDNGIMRMRKINELVIPANDSVFLSPEGIHIMLVGLYKKLLVGDVVVLDLILEDNSSIIINTIVKK